MHEDDLAMPRQNKIGRARQITPVQPETKTERVHGAPHDNLRAGIRLSDSRHTLRKGESGTSQLAAAIQSTLIPLQNCNFAPKGKLIGVVSLQLKILSF